MTLTNSTTSVARSEIKRVAIIHNYEDVRELITFVLQSQMNVLCSTYAQFSDFKSQTSGLEHLVICDLQLPDAEATDIARWLQTEKKKSSLLVLTSQDLPASSEFPFLKILKKPFTDSELLQACQEILGANTNRNNFVPVSIQLLKKMRQIPIPIFVKINDMKYVKLSNDKSLFSDELYSRYQDKQVSFLYVERPQIVEFIADYRKEVLAEIAWTSISTEEASEFISLNIEMLKKMTDELGWREEVAKLAEENTLKALSLTKRSPILIQVFAHFQRIERFGYSDHCTLLVYLCSGLATELNIASSTNLRKLTIAALLHDISLSDSQYENKRKLLKQIEKGETSQDIKDLMGHPAKAARLCRNWAFSPPNAEDVIVNHHELPNGKGFPAAKKSADLDLLSCIFILAEDFVNHYIETLGEITIDRYVLERKEFFSDEPFAKIFSCLTR